MAAWRKSGTTVIQCAMLHAALHTVSFVYGCFAGKCILTGSTEKGYFKVDGSMEKKWEYCYTVCNVACSIAHCIICTLLFRGKMHSDWFNGIAILQGRWQHEKRVGYCYTSGLEKTLSKWDIYVPLVTKGLKKQLHRELKGRELRSYRLLRSE